MGQHESRLTELKREAWRLSDHDEAKVFLLERAIKLADVSGNEKDQYDLRVDYIEAATFSGFPEKSMIAFSWCLAKSNTEPEKFALKNLLWKFKHILESAAEFSQLSLDKMAALVEQMTDAYLKCNQSLRPVYTMRSYIALKSGQPQAALDYVRQSFELKRDYYADCSACEAHLHCMVLIANNEYEQALSVARPLLHRRLSCAEVPDMTYAHILLPLLRLGRKQEADTYQDTGYKMIARNREFISEFAQHLEYLSVTGRLQKAITIFEQHLAWAEESKVDYRRFNYFVAALNLLETLRLQMQTISLNLNSHSMFYQQSNRYDIDELIGRFRQQCEELAGCFDRRNHNNSASQKYQRRSLLL